MPLFRLGARQFIDLSQIGGVLQVSAAIGYAITHQANSEEAH
jgi:hypothetical protein